jgi:hypothetical protein
MEQFAGVYDPSIENQQSQLSRDTSVKVIDEIGRPIMEQSRLNGVKIRCEKPMEANAPIQCQIDRGGGWQQIIVL